MKKLFFCFFLLIGSYAYSENINLKANFLHLPEGSYLTLQNKDLYTFFHVLSQSEEKVRFQEASITKDNFNKLKVNWSQWLSENFTDHASHLIYTLDKASGELGAIYQVKEDRWVSAKEFSSFLQTLLNLEFSKVPDEKRKKLGHPPDGFREDRRPYWNPKITYEGHDLKGIACDEWISIWPQDNSEFAGVHIHLFLPQDGQIPLQIPYWISFQDRAFYQIIRTIDAGISRSTS